MSVLSDSEFAEKKMMALASPAQKFEPSATHDPDGDCVEFLAKPDSFYGERVDDLVTVHYSQETGEVVGSLIKGISGFCRAISETMPGFRIEIRDGRIRLVHVFRARLWGSKRGPGDLATLTYEKVIEVAEGPGVEAEMCFT